MKAVVQRVSSASVSVENKVVGEIKQGLLILLGVHEHDAEESIEKLAQKVLRLRIFSDAEDKMNTSVQDISGDILVVSQFTLYGDTQKGNRPSFIEAANPTKAKDFYIQFVNHLKKSGLTIATGQFQAMMQVSLVNDGPVTLILEM